MKFLIVAPRFHTNLYYRAKALHDAGHTVKVIVLYSPILFLLRKNNRTFE